VLKQLGAAFRTPTLVAKTYFAAKEMEEAERDRLTKQKGQLEEDFTLVRKRALELMSPDGNEADRGETGQDQPARGDPNPTSDKRVGRIAGVRERPGGGTGCVGSLREHRDPLRRPASPGASPS